MKQTNKICDQKAVNNGRASENKDEGNTTLKGHLCKNI